MSGAGRTTVTTDGPVATRERVPAATEAELEQYRRELTGYCYRMLASSFDAEDAVQETMVRAWRAVDRFDGRSSLRSWMYRIATNVCLDSLAGRKRRALPMDLTAAPSAPVASSLNPPLPEVTWVEPVPDGRVMADGGDPADVAVARESVRLAFVVALQRLPPRQRAVLILREVLRWKADEVAELLDTSVASVNSALQRARATVGATERKGRPGVPLGEEHKDLLAKYVDAFERYDMTTLVALLHEDATQSMPPYDLWISGADDVVAWFVGPGAACRGSRLLPVRANGSVGMAQYKPGGAGGRYEPWGIHLFEVADGRVSSITTFLDTKLFALFGLPPHLDP